jgi:hypothetical protein
VTAKKSASAAGDEEVVESRSWDEFWAEIERQEADERGEAATTVIRGVRVVIPHDLPLRFDRRLEAVQDSSDDADVHAVVAELFGEDVFDAWVDAGMRSKEFRTVLLWGIANGRGRAMTFAEAYEAVTTEGKSLMPNRSARRASARSGGASKRTSAASTASHRKR